MTVKEIINFLENIASPALQENYDNTGLIIGSSETECTGILVALDATDEVVHEAIEKKCNLLIVHHPIIFGGLKKINPNGYVGKSVIAAIKNDIAIYAIHTNLDNVLHGVNGKMASQLQMTEISVLSPKNGALSQIVTYVPTSHLDKVRDSLFSAGAGQIGNYDEAAFVQEGLGSFRALKGAKPFIGQEGKRHYEKEVRLELIFPTVKQTEIISVLKSVHPYEEVAYNVTALSNHDNHIGSGLIGSLPQAMEELAFLKLVKDTFSLKVLRHTRLTGNKIRRVALCGGAGSFLISKALSAKADIFLT
ncbi:MAG: Nif3-like dinuclear metal center hexameric protein, partial [Chitinophagaceae bacterium]